MDQEHKNTLENGNGKSCRECKALFDAAPLPVCVFGADDMLVYCNRPFADLDPVSTENISFRELFRTGGTESASQITAEQDLILRTGSGKHLQVKARAGRLGDLTACYLNVSEGLPAESEPYKELVLMLSSATNFLGGLIMCRKNDAGSSEANDHIIVQANGTMAGYLGLHDPEAFTGKPLSHLLAQGNYTTLEKNITKACRSGQSLQTELPIELEEAKHWYYCQIVPFGQGLFIYLNDVSQKKAAETEIAEMVEKYHLLFESNPIPLLVVSRHDKRILAANISASEHYSLKDSTGRYRQFNEIFTLHGPAFSNSFNFSGHAVYAAEDGSSRHVELHSKDVIYEGIEAALLMLNDATDRIKAEKKLLHSEAHLVSLLENTKEGVFSIDPDCRIKSFNTNFRELIIDMYEAEIEPGMNYLDILTPERRKAFLKNFNRALQGERFFFETSYVTPRGNERFYEIYVNPIFTEDKITGVSYYTREITEQRRIEETIRRSEEKYRSLVENLAEGVLYMDPEGQMVFANDQFYNILGYKTGELYTLPGSAVLHYKTEPAIDLKIEPKKGSEQYELELQRKNGSPLWVFVNSTPLFHQDGKVAGSLSTLSDITERKISQQKAQEKDLHYRKLVETMYEGVLFVDRDFRVQLTNKRMCDMMGREEHEITGHTATDFFPLQEDKDMILSQKELRERNQSGQYEARLQNRNGELLWVLINGSPLHNEQGEYIGSLGTISDITALKMTEERLKATNLDLNTFVYKASHDLKGPLSSIMGLTQLAENEVADDTALLYLKLIKQGTERLDKIISDLLDTVKIKEGAITLSEIEFEPLVKEVLQSLEHAPNFNRLKIETIISQEEEFQSDKKILTSVVQNLLDNAIKYQDKTKEQSYIKLECRVDNGYARLKVQDNGVGIPQQVQDKVFSMFFRANQDSSGTGLGLFIVKNAIEKLGGNVTLESEEGKGSKFEVNLPGKPGLVS